MEMGRPTRQDPRFRQGSGAGASILGSERPSPRGRRSPRSGALERSKVLFFSLDRSDLPRMKQFSRSGAPLLFILQLALSA
jgi:hypothetical protein